jgi:hypothetical protein
MSKKTAGRYLLVLIGFVVGLMVALVGVDYGLRDHQLMAWIYAITTIAILFLSIRLLFLPEE